MTNLSPGWLIRDVRKCAARMERKKQMADIPDHVIEAAWAAFAKQCNADVYTGPEQLRAAGRVFVEWERDRMQAEVQAAFEAGFWAWNGPSNPTEFDRDMKLMEEAREEYCAAIRARSKEQ